MQHNISIISGPPGSGKTTVIKGLLKIIEQHFHGPIVQLSAPTGRACSALADKTGHNASTFTFLISLKPQNPHSRNVGCALFMELTRKQF